jgi:phospho-N-acetylmuramoyl-pentapeptide-transferase
LFGGKFIRALKVRQNGGQPIRDDGPESHIESKKGTPTMGGLMILFSVVTGSMLWSDLSNYNVWLCLAVMLGFGAIGAIDDYRKVKTRDYHGISGKRKILYQALVSITCYCIYSSLSSFSEAQTVFLPIFKNCKLDLGFFFVIWFVIIVIGSSNAVNLTDGLDGLAMGPVIMSSICFAVICYLVGNSLFAEYLHVKYVPGMSEVCIFLSSLVGASLGFMWFNAPPARVMMGDTGSLAIGGVLGFIAVLSKYEIVYILIGGVFVVETVSVILQVASFKLTGKRIFLMAPIHHHFEKKGWTEPTIVFRFWIISIVLGILGLSTLKIR